MTATKTRIEAELVTPNRSHWLATRSQSGGPFEHEELFPILEVRNVPRVGTVRARCEARRYVSSSWDGSPGEWGAWNVILREIVPADVDPNLSSQNVPGVGDKTRTMIREAVEPVILAYFETDDYKASRQRAAFHAARRILTDTRWSPVAVDGTRRELVRYADDMTPAQFKTLNEALWLFDRATAELEKEEK